MAQKPWRIFMETFKKNLSKEFCYIKFNKIVIFLVAILCLVFAINEYNEIVNFKTLSRTFERTVEEVERNGDNLNELLNEAVSTTEEVQENGNIILQVDNIVRYDYEQLKAQFVLMQPSENFANVLKNSTLVYLPLIAGLIGIYFSSYDLTRNTLKTRLLDGSPQTLFFTKLVVSFFTFFVSYVVSLLFLILISFFWTPNVISAYKSLFNSIIYEVDIYAIFGAILGSLFISWFTLVLTYSIGYLIKKNSISIVIFCTYHLLVPNLGKLDFKNFILNFYLLSYKDSSVVLLPRFVKLNSIMTVSLLLFTISVFLLISFIRFNRMSKYSLE